LDATLPTSIQEGGIGCVLGKVDDKVCIVSVLKSGGAALSKIGFCEGDEIVQVNGMMFTASASCDQVAAELRGKVQTAVRVWIRRKKTGKMVSATIVRQPVKGKPIKEAVLEDGHLVPALAPQNNSARRSLRILPAVSAGFLHSIDCFIASDRGLCKPSLPFAPELERGRSAPPSKGCYFA
jgi:hypothetical protein